MANKRRLKKLIRRNCASIACECIGAMMYGQGVDDDKMVQVLVDTGRLQQSTLGMISFAFDKTPRDFETERAYRRARRAYFSEAYARLLREFADHMEGIVAKMNDAVSPEGRKANVDKE